MMNLKNNLLIVLVCACLTLAACSPEPGSQAWCDVMDKKSKGDWSVNEAAEYAKSCVFKQQD